MSYDFGVPRDGNRAASPAENRAATRVVRAAAPCCAAARIARDAAEAARMGAACQPPFVTMVFHEPFFT